MTSAWDVLTWRGRVMMLVGAAVSAVAWLQGERDIVWLGLFLFLSPLVAMALVMFAAPKVTVRRRISPGLAPLGKRFSAELELTRSSPLWGGLLFFEDTVPRGLAHPPRFTIEQWDPRTPRRISYSVVGRRRGRFHTGPLTVESRDPLGLARIRREHDATTEFRVTPHIEQLDSLPVGADGGSSGEAATSRVGSTGEDDAIVREYRHGDDMRRVHWRSSAKHGDLMVRREEQSLDPSAVILLDSRSVAHAGPGAASSLEWAISAAGSVAIHLTKQGHRVRIVDTDGTAVHAVPGHEWSVGMREILEYLTDLQPSATSHLNSASTGLFSGVEARLLIGIVGRLTPLETQQLSQLHTRGRTAAALLMDTGSFGATTSSASDHERSSAALSAAQWKTVVVSKGTSVAQAWRELGVGNRR